MEKIRLKTDFVTEKDDLARCPVCEVYVHQTEGFTCPRCKKGPLCRRHRVAGKKECASCVFDIRKKELNALRHQELSIRQFIRFLQFIFLFFAVMFIAVKAGMAEFVEVLQHLDLAQYLVYLGILPVAGYIAFMIVLFSQKGKINEVEIEIRKLDMRRS